MSQKKLKKVLAGMLAGTMVLGLSSIAFAADGDPAGTGNTTGSGEFEGHVNKEVLLVQLPTVPENNDTTFAYTMDPEGLIAATEGAKNKDADFEKGANVYFLSKENTYTKDSAKLKVINKGNVDADVTIKAETDASNDKVTMAADTTFAADDKTAKLYLGLKVAGKDAVAIKKAGDTTPASVTVGLYGTPDNFEVTYDSDAKTYGYSEKADLSDTAWNSFEFGLTGACNPNGDWSTENLAAPDVTVTWSYVKHADGTEMLDKNAVETPQEVGPSIAVKEYNYDRTATFNIVTDFGAGDLAATSISSVKIGPDGTTFGTDLTSACTISGNTITFPSGKLGTASVGDKKYVQVTFDKGDPVVLTLTITK